MKIEHRIEIEAPVERVWELTLDVESWPQLTPTITSVERLDAGPMGLGSQARIKQPAQGTRVWTVTEFEPGRRFAWATRLLGHRMTGRHDLMPRGSGMTNTLTVDIEGPFAPVIGRIAGGQIRKAIRLENEGFKRAAEGASASDPTAVQAAS